MSKMKHLLRKLHNGGGLNEHQRLGEARTTSSTPSGSSPSSGLTGTTSSTPSGSSSGSMGRIRSNQV
ncbi:hypothetical protein SLEP1_g24279 [Rubroshorea leprosula]|uniref:Uncharacterized protein n=1 Tax=Rubroshorea leprosula TaxID=152421 RepID=A0AAV5JF46_9ROSI|nr:hypothetical protein SLEP1_g24279 [Rubroshorea leprosula]